MKRVLMILSAFIGSQIGYPEVVVFSVSITPGGAKSCDFRCDDAVSQCGSEISKCLFARILAPRTALLTGTHGSP